MILRESVDSSTLCALLDSFACPALILDAERRVQAVNSAFRARIGVSPDAVGARCHDLLHGRNRRCLRREEFCPLDACLRTGTVIPAIHSHVIGAAIREEQVLLRPILAEDGTVVACLATLIGLQPAGQDPDEEASGRAALALAPVERHLERLARSRRPLLLVGEPGTGKSSVARAIHRLGRSSEAWEERSGLELTADRLRELWAVPRNTGRAGTLYLRDVHALSLPAQDALVGLLTAPRSRRSWRLIAGTDRDLRSQAAVGFFQQGLLGCFGPRRLRLPPLRERWDELPGMVTALLQEIGSAALVVTGAALERLRRHSFPGNLDELAQALRHASLMAPRGTVDVEHLPDWLNPPVRPSPASQNDVGVPGPRGRTPRGSSGH